MLRYVLVSIYIKRGEKIVHRRKLFIIQILAVNNLLRLHTFRLLFLSRQTHSLLTQEWKK